MTLVFSIHYFLWYGALTSIFGYEGVYARYYTKATTMQYGYLNMVLPFMTVLVAPAICSLADRRRSHRAYFTVSLLVTMVAMSLFTMMPLLISDDKLGTKTKIGSNQNQSQQVSDLQILPWICFCLMSLLCDLSLGINTCLSDSFAVLQAEENNTSFGRIIVWGTFGWASSGLILCLINQATFLPRLVPGLLYGTTLLAIDIMIVSYWPYDSDFKLDIIPLDAAQTLTGSTSIAHREPNDYLPLNESARINLGTEFVESSRGSGSGKLIRKTRSPVDICNETLGIAVAKKSDDDKLSLDPMILSVKTINSESDLPNSSSEVSGTIRSASLSDPSSSARRNYSDSESTSPYNRKHLPPRDSKLLGEEKIVLPAKKLVANSEPPQPPPLQTSDQKRKSAGKRSREILTSFRVQMILLLLIMQRRKSLIRYFVLFILSGFFMSMHWNYFFLYLEDIYYKKFELISAISMVGQSIFGELPFFILSRKVIDQVGRSHTLSISVISIGLRFLLYGYLLPNTSMYFIVVADCFQGPNYGLFYVVMTEVGLEYSYCDDDTIERLASRGELDRNNKRQVDSVRLSLRSTVQSVAFACYEGVGVGLGSLVGGWIVARYGFKTLWLVMSFCSILVGAGNLLVEFTCIEPDSMLTHEELACPNSEQREFLDAKRRGTLKKLASPQPLPPLPSASAAQAPRPLSPLRFLQQQQRGKVHQDTGPLKNAIGARGVAIVAAAMASAKPLR